MKKILVSFLICLGCISAFGANPSGVAQNRVHSELRLPRQILLEVIQEDDELANASGAMDRMMAKYDEFAGPNEEGITKNEMYEICRASQVEKVMSDKNECLARVFNPAFAKIRTKIFVNVCKSNVSGGNPHCVDDVFVEGKKQNGNPYHQDVFVGPYTANGFAIEYAKKQGHDVWCGAEIKDSTVLCTTLDNKEFYSVKFKGTNNTIDSNIERNLTRGISGFDPGIEKNLIKGICALTDTQYIEKGFQGISSDGHMGLDVNIESSDGCLMKCDFELLSKFGLIGKNEKRKISANEYKDFCAMHINEQIILNRYPGYEYMTDAFRQIQTVYDGKLEKALETYVKLQGIDVSSFECVYTPSPQDASATYLGEVLGVSIDDVANCKINGTPVSFVFDDLYEPKDWEQRAGTAAIQCVLAGGNFGDDKTCRGLTKSDCLSERVQNMLGGPNSAGWDEANQVCVIRDVEVARHISQNIQIGAGIALSIVFPPAGAPVLALTTIGTSVAYDLASIWVENLRRSEPNSRVMDFATDAGNCHIPQNSQYPSCSQEQVDCAWHVIHDHFAGLDEILEKLNPDQLEIVSNLMENVTDCLSDDLLNSATNTSTLQFRDKLLNNADTILLIAGLVIQPENGIRRFTTNAPKMTRVFGRLKMLERASAQIDNTRYLRVFVDNIGQDDIRALTNEFRNNGLHVSSELQLAENGRYFIGISETPIAKLEVLSNTEREWQTLWHEYAPANQTLSDFKAMANNNLDEMRQLVKNMTPYSEAASAIRLMQPQLLTYDDELAAFETLLKKHNLTMNDIPQNESELQRFFTRYPDLKEPHQSLVNQQVKIIMLRNEQTRYLAGNYSTYNPEFSRIAKPYLKRKDAIVMRYNQELERAYSNFMARTNNTMGPAEFRQTPEAADILQKCTTELNLIIRDFQYEIAAKFTLENLGTIANERADIFAEILTNNPYLANKLVPDTWAKLSMNERSNIAQIIANEFAAETGTPFVRTRLDSESNAYYARYLPGTNLLEFNPNIGTLDSPSNLLNSLSHEQGHFIDYIAANRGALGEQFAYYANQLYPEIEENGYRIALTEQSSHVVGATVADRITGVSEIIPSNQY